MASRTRRAWTDLAPLVDEALDLPEALRPAWLAALARTRPEAAAAVAAFVERHRRVVAEHFLDDAEDASFAFTLSASNDGVRLIRQRRQFR